MLGAQCYICSAYIATGSIYLYAMFFGRKSIVHITEIVVEMLVKKTYFS